LVDRDRNGFISFREFLDMLVVFAKGSAEDKAGLMFEMYDIDRSGMLSAEEFGLMVRSMVEAANADVRAEDIETLVKSMLASVKPQGWQPHVSHSIIYWSITNHNPSPNSLPITVPGISGRIPAPALSSQRDAGLRAAQLPRPQRP
jgi:hypothetical protein